MFAKNNDLNDNQKAYHEYYLEQFAKSIIIGTLVLLIAYIPFSLYFSQISAFMAQGQIQSDHLTVFFICGVVSVAVSLCFAKWLIDHYLKIYVGVYLAIYTILLALVLHSEMQSNVAIFVSYLLYITVPLILTLFYIGSEYSSLKKSSNVIKYITPNTYDDQETHTAVILAHDENKPIDGGDINAQPLLDVLNGKEKFQIYFCLHEKEMATALTKSSAKRIWIFGHGTKGGCRLTDKFFSYADFMTEKTKDGWKIRDIAPKEYVYQCHCNPKSESVTPLTDYLLASKGVLDSKVDDMPNYYDSGLVDLEIDNPQENRLLLNDMRFNRMLGYFLHKDFNYNDSLSVNYIIKKYEAHLEKKSKLPNNEINDQSN